MNPKDILKQSLKQLPPLKNYSSRKEWEAACWRQILKSEQLLSLFTTSKGRHDLIVRVAAANGLVSGKNYREISREFFISLQTIRSAKKALEENGYRSYFERSKTERKKKIYSPGPKRKPKREWREGKRPRRTKYGTIWVPQ